MLYPGYCISIHVKLMGTLLYTDRKVPTRPLMFIESAQGRKITAMYIYIYKSTVIWP